jgi:predicted membrane-bound spermidine synthase
MYKELAELTVKTSEDYYGKVVKALQDAGFVIVQRTETYTDRCYIVAKREEKGDADSN